MAKPHDQDPAPEDATPPSAVRGEATRSAILRAAAELIAEVGWCGVTTRLVAERAAVPHGAVGYHFRGKADVLRQAALGATAAALAEPIELARSAPDLASLLIGTAAWFGNGGLTDAGTAQLFETAREATRDEALREPLAAMIREYRSALVDLVRRDRDDGKLRPDLDADAAGGLLAALLDGLLLHLVVDPEVDGRHILGAASMLMEARA